MNMLITGGRVIDPANNREGVFDVLVLGGKISKVAKKIRNTKKVPVIDAKGLWVMPGLVDVHTHLREPGGEVSETIESGTRSAAAGGVTSVFCMANTRPVTDSAQQVNFIVKRAQEKALVRVYPMGAVTKNLEGKEITDMYRMVRAGCKAFSDDGHTIMDSQVLRSALLVTKPLGVPLVEHAEDEYLSSKGVMNEGAVSKKLGYSGIPAAAEAIIIARDIYISELTGAHVHFAHVSAKESVELIRNAKKKGIRVTAETCPHYFSLTEEAVQRCGTNAKMKPPLRTDEDVEAVKEALADETLDVISTDHAPHDQKSKSREFSKAPFGIIGLETYFALVYNELILTKILSPLKALQKVSLEPAGIFNIPAGTLSPGAPADITLFDPTKTWLYTRDQIFSKSTNSPFIGRKFKGKIMTTIVGGKTVYNDGKVV